LYPATIITKIMEKMVKPRNASIDSTRFFFNGGFTVTWFIIPTPFREEPL